MSGGTLRMDWFFILNCYNNTYKTNYVSIKFFLKLLYIECKSVYVMEDILGVSRPCITKMMKRCGIKLRKKGWQPDDTTTKKYMICSLSDEVTKYLTIPQIAAKLNMSVEYTYRVLEANNKPYKHLRTKEEISC
jgi:predicted DNA-binding transcriptional regulator AlpA